METTTAREFIVCLMIQSVRSTHSVALFADEAAAASAKREAERHIELPNLSSNASICLRPTTTVWAALCAARKANHTVTGAHATVLRAVHSAWPAAIHTQLGCLHPPRAQSYPMGSALRDAVGESQCACPAPAPMRRVAASATGLRRPCAAAAAVANRPARPTAPALRTLSHFSRLCGGAARAGRPHSLQFMRLVSCPRTLRTPPTVAPPRPRRRPEVFSPYGPLSRHAPSGSATGASRLPHDPGMSVSRLSSLSFSQLLTLGYGAGNARAASAAPVLTIQPLTPTQAYGTHCPPMVAMLLAVRAAHSAARTAEAVARRMRAVKLSTIVYRPGAVRSPLQRSRSGAGTASF